MLVSKNNTIFAKQMEKDDKPQKIGNNSEISKISNDVVPYKFDTSSIETYIQLENLADKLENSSMVDAYKEYRNDYDLDGNIIEGTRRLYYNKASLVTTLALGIELGITPMKALAFGKQLDSKAIIKIERGYKLGLDFSTALDQIFIWQSGGRDIVYTSIGIVNAVLNKLNITQEIIEDGSMDVVDYHNLLTNEHTSIFNPEFKIIPKFVQGVPVTGDALSAIIERTVAENSIPVRMNSFKRASVRLTRYSGKQITNTVMIPYTSQEAIDAGLLGGINSKGEKIDGKDNWNKHTAALLRKMSIMNGARIIAGDALYGIYEKDELTIDSESTRNNRNNVEDASHEELN